MSGVSDSALLDLAKATLNNLGAPKIQQIAQSLQEYIVPSKLMNLAETLKGSKGIQRTLMLKQSDTAQFKGLFAKDNLNIPSLLQQIVVPWVHLDDGWAWERREILENTGESLIANIIKPRRGNCMLNIFKQLEEKFWGLVSTDPLIPWGLQYWIVKNASAGFNGGVPSGYTTVGGVSPTTFPNWTNWTDQYTVVSPADLIAKMRLAQYKTQFKSPINIADINSITGSNRKIFTTWAVYEQFIRIAQQQNENLGSDLSKYANMVLFSGLEIKPVPQLDVLAENDVYMIDFDSFQIKVLEGDNMRESEPKFSKDSHNVMEQYIDFTFNFMCVDRRANAVIDAA